MSLPLTEIFTTLEVQTLTPCMLFHIQSLKYTERKIHFSEFERSTEIDGIKPINLKRYKMLLAINNRSDYPMQVTHFKSIHMRL